MSRNNRKSKGSQRQKSVAKPRTSSLSLPLAAPLSEGTPAPDFALKSTPDQTISLKEFRNTPVVLIFYPADFSPVCGDEMALFNELLPEFNRFNGQLLGISEDNVWSHIAFTKARNLKFPLLSDFNPRGAVARQYGVYREEDGTAERALFVIDGDGIIRWSYVSPVGVNPGANGVLAALESLGKEEKG
ncbi:MAG TPA: peroxiredoxin [Nitrososphaeraceae archaeon]|jgi:peroxiredoxin (alkyl hydroperoxide reductase subunit C)|nr:peroxiredoxin [Nitrososphaeraceae archaeon]